MREIKFRGWYGNKIGMLEPSFNGNINEIFADRNGVYMQYTGLKDDNGKEIYEGDILDCESYGVNRYELRVVCYDSNQARFKGVPLPAYHSNAGNGGWTGYDLYRTHCEVLGSIYENPELLKEG